MRHLRRRILFDSFKLADLLIMVIAFGVAMISEQQSSSSPLELFLAMRVSILNLLFFLGYMLFWQSLFTFLGLYYSMRLSSKHSEALAVFRATTLGTLAIYIGSILFNVSLVTPLFLFVFWLITTGFTIISRMVLRNLLGRVRPNGMHVCNILLVGTGERAIQFAETILRKPHLGYSLVGFVDGHWHDADTTFKDLFPMVAPADLSEFLRSNVVDEVLICLPPKEYYNQHKAITAVCSEQGVIVRILADLFFSQLAHSRVEYFEGNAIITTYAGGGMEGVPLFCKRLIDVVVSVILLIVMSPLFFVIGLVIKLSSKGSVFFVQKRLGLNKRTFNFYKFRTMVENAEAMQKDLEDLNEADGPVFKIKKDPRITREGRLLRMTSLDEFPQLLNVLKGDMSLVGPRPLPIRDYEGFDQHWFNRRFSVRPGMTCIWQIDGRSDLSFEEWIQLDLRYIDTWSLGLDLQILFGTIPAVLKCRGAS